MSFACLVFFFVIIIVTTPRIIVTKILPNVIAIVPIASSNRPNIFGSCISFKTLIEAALTNKKSKVLIFSPLKQIILNNNY